MLSTPLQVILICKSAGEHMRAAMEGCFRGQGGGYLSGVDDLNVPVRGLSAAPNKPAHDILTGPLHTIAVVLIDREVMQDKPLLAWINELGRLIEVADPQHALLLIDLDGSFDAFSAAVPGANWSQAMPAHDLGEAAVQTTVATLIALDLATKAVTYGTDLVPDKLQFFVSHAKLDGQPLAWTLKDQIKRLPGFQGFYDADDIAPGTNWKKALRQGVQDSVVVALRSKAFESRVWCIQELHWAEYFGSPIVVVDLRHDLIHPPSVLNFGQSYAVHVPDGNIYRIIFVALREGLRARIHIRTVQHFVDIGKLSADALEIIVRRPTMLSLQAACDALATKPEGIIVYPDPPLASGEFQAAEAIVSSAGSHIWLTTPQSLMAGRHGPGTVS